MASSESRVIVQTRDHPSGLIVVPFAVGEFYNLLLVEGIVGLNFLNQFREIHFDVPARRLTLTLPLRAAPGAARRRAPGPCSRTSVADPPVRLYQRARDGPGRLAVDDRFRRAGFTGAAWGSTHRSSVTVGLE